MKFPMDRPVKIVMLGAGGTGGYVAPYLFRLLHMLDSSIVCNGSFLFLEKSFPGIFTHASKFAAVFFIAWNNADRTRSGSDFLFT